MLRSLVLLGLLLLLPCPAPACSFCPSPIQRFSLGMELERADLAFFGYALNPRRNLDPSALPGSGTTEMHIERVLKDHPILKDKVITLERYIPVLDPKQPPRFIVFCEVYKGKLDPYVGRPAKSPAVLEYLEAARAERAKGPEAALVYYARFLGHPDDVIAEDAFLEFARASDQDVGNAARRLDPVPLRKLLQNPKIDADRISLFAFLLGSCGTTADADFLRQRILAAKDEDQRALDGLLGGYIALRPKEGWDLTLRMLADSKENFAKRFAALRTVRFYQGWKPAETMPFMLRGYQSLIPDGEMADLAIEDLRRWKKWDLTKSILEQYGKPSHAAPIIKRSILRYALCCPTAEAASFIERINKKEKAVLDELRESLQFEKDSK